MTSAQNWLRQQLKPSRATLVLLLMWALIVGFTTPLGRRGAGDLTDLFRTKYYTTIGWSSLTFEPAPHPRLVVFTDFTCAHCSAADSVVQELQALQPTLEVDHRHVWRSSQSKRLATLWACMPAPKRDVQAVHEVLHDSGTGLPFDDPIASDLLSGLAFNELEVAEIADCLSHPNVDVIRRIRSDSIMAKKVGLRATPTFFGPEGRVVGIPSVEDLHRILGLRR